MKRSGHLYDLYVEALKLPVVTKRGTLTMTRNAGGTFAMIAWALPDDTDPADLTGELLKTATPASWITAETLQEQVDTPGMTPGEKAAFHGNIFARVERSWLPVGAWTACRGRHHPRGQPRIRRRRCRLHARLFGRCDAVAT